MNNEVEQVLKEFEKLGYTYTIGLSSIKLFHKETREEILIWNDKTYRTDNWLTFEEHQLLTKIFKAMRWFDE